MEKKKKEAGETAKMGLPEGETRYSVIVDQEQLDKMKSVSQEKNFPMKGIFAEAMAMWIKAYEKKFGTIKSKKQPARPKGLIS